MLPVCLFVCFLFLYLRSHSHGCFLEWSSCSCPNVWILTPSRSHETHFFLAAQNSNCWHLWCSHALPPSTQFSNGVLNAKAFGHLDRKHVVHPVLSWPSWQSIVYDLLTDITRNGMISVVSYVTLKHPMREISTNEFKERTLGCPRLVLQLRNTLPPWGQKTLFVFKGWLQEGQNQVSLNIRNLFPHCSENKRHEIKVLISLNSLGKSARLFID